MGLGVRGLKDLMPTDSGASQRAAQYMQQAQGQKYIPQGGGQEKSISGGAMAGMGGALAGAELGTIISTSAAAGPWGAAIGGTLALGSYLLG